MRLLAFNIRMYKTIRDSGRVEVRPDVTCLLGKNESGKSAVLQAIWKSRNVASVGYDMLYDYPKESYSRDRKSNPVVASLEFELEERDHEAFDNDIGGPRPTGIRVDTRYNGEREITFDIATEPPDLSGARKAVEEVASAIAAHEGTEGTNPLGVLVAPLEVLRKALADPENGQVLRQVAAKFRAVANGKPLGVDLDPLDLADYRSVIEAREAVSTWIGEHLPVFIYFDQYGLLRTRINLRTFLAAAKKTPPEPEVRTQMALFEWAGLDATELLHLGQPKQNGEEQAAIERRKEERSTILESASYALTGDWEQWWSQRRHELKIDADGEDLVLKVSDDENPWKIDFQERSKGFQWFFSFYLTFLVESEKAHNGAILLLDEPGLSLHVTAQQSLLKFFRRLSEKNQVIFSTHSPFLVDPDHIEDVRTVYLKEDAERRRRYTQVSSGPSPEGDHDTLLPLQAAVGYDLAQTLFLGRKTLIVEGITDYWILKSLDRKLKAGGKPGLPDDVVVLFAGGTSHMIPLVSLFARPDDDDRRLVVLLDADKAGLDKANKLKTDMLLRSGSVALMSDPDLLGAGKNEVEDMIDRVELAAHLRRGRGDLAEPSTTPNGNTAYLKAMFAGNGLGEFDHQAKARVLLGLVDSWREGADPTAMTLANAERVLSALAARFASGR